MQTAIGVAAALMLAAGLTGCAMSLTDFDFPRFGLTDKQDRNQSGLPPDQQPSSRLSQQQ